MHKQKCFLKIFFMYSFDDSTDIQNLRSCGSISPKTILIFPKNFLNFSSVTIEKQSIVNLSNYSSKSYTSVVLSDSELAFFWRGKMQLFFPILYHVLVIYGVA